MNLIPKIIFYPGVAALVLMFLVPPWQGSIERTESKAAGNEMRSITSLQRQWSYSGPIGYYPIYDPPKPGERIRTGISHYKEEEGDFTFLCPTTGQKDNAPVPYAVFSIHWGLLFLQTAIVIMVAGAGIFACRTRIHKTTGEKL